MTNEQETQLAKEIASTLNDRLSIGLYLKYARTVPHDVLRDALQRVCVVKDADIVVSRAAIFTAIIQQYLKDIYAGSGN